MGAHSDTVASTPGRLAAASEPFLRWLETWLAEREPLDLAALITERPSGPRSVAVISADLVVGFCYKGNLASPRIADIVEPSAALFRRAHELGVRDFALLQEYHSHDALEFDQFGVHCVRETDEAETVPALLQLPFAGELDIIHKNTIHPALNTTFDAWLGARPELDTFICVGDCTDLCVYQLATHLKLSGNAAGKRVNVIVPADCVQTYDLGVEAAGSLGAMPHDGNMMHALFLYHMALNGVVVSASVI